MRFLENTWESSKSMHKLLHAQTLIILHQCFSILLENTYVYICIIYIIYYIYFYIYKRNIIFVS